MNRIISKRTLREAEKNQRIIRTELSDRIELEFNGRSDPLIRAVKFDLDQNYHGKITIFGHQDTIAVAAMVRVGLEPRNAAAAVDQGYVFAAPIGLPMDEWPSHGNFETIDIVTLADGSQHAIFADDVPPLEFDTYDCWAMKCGKPVAIDSYDPTRKTMTGELPYHHVAKVRVGRQSR